MASWGYYGANIEIKNTENSDVYGFIFKARVDLGVAAVANAPSACGETECVVAVDR